jgi:hypothetical protein
MALLLFSLTARIQIGIRLILPVVVLAIVGLAGAAAELRRALALSGKSGSVSPWPHTVGYPSLIAMGVLWTAISAVWVWPEGLCYTNEAWGDTDQGYLYLSDSNYDWGQGLKELAEWQREHSDAKLDVWYFGADPALERLPMRHVPLHIWPITKPEDVLPVVQGNYVAVSTTLLYGMVADSPAHRAAQEFFLKHQPASRTTTFLIFDFRVNRNR